MEINTKKCNKCLEILPFSEFSPSGGGKYLRPECKKCANKLCKERKILRDRHGQPPDEYICPICLKDKTDLQGIGGRANTPWAIDHKHSTIELKFRGFLCHNCNRAIGNFNEDTERLKRAIEYLQSFEE
jgi:hypothetical protein